ncbi:MAG: hypothetical protein M3Y84_03525 [Acidobacteriota bacterium]|nr:hypothetical protein [Acidobacteriota bacterium]
MIVTQNLGCCARTKSLRTNKVCDAYFGDLPGDATFAGPGEVAGDTTGEVTGTAAGAVLGAGDDCGAGVAVPSGAVDCNTE